MKSKEQQYAENNERARKNRERYNVAKYERINEHKRIVNEIKSTNPCSDCGEFYPFYVMEFDHRNRQEKHKKVSSMYGCKLESILAEIEKCDLVCSNCHRARTYQHIQDDPNWGAWRKSDGPVEGFTRRTPKGYLASDPPEVSAWPRKGRRASVV